MGAPTLSLPLHHHAALLVGGGGSGAVHESAVVDDVPTVGHRSQSDWRCHHRCRGCSRRLTSWSVATSWTSAAAIDLGESADGGGSALVSSRHLVGISGVGGGDHHIDPRHGGPVFRRVGGPVVVGWNQDPFCRIRLRTRGDPLHPPAPTCGGSRDIGFAGVDPDIPGPATDTLAMDLWAWGCQQRHGLLEPCRSGWSRDHQAVAPGGDDCAVGFR